MRNYEVYECQAKYDKSMLKDRPSPVRSTSGG
jgi:hypothetical protein